MKAPEYIISEIKDEIYQLKRIKSALERFSLADIEIAHAERRSGIEIKRVARNLGTTVPHVTNMVIAREYLIKRANNE